MSSRKLLFALCAALALGACQDEGPAPDCTTGKCDQIGDVGQLMQGPLSPGNITRVRDGDSWRFQVTGDKGAIVLLSKEYADSAAAANALLSVEENGVLAERYSVVGSSGRYTLELKAANGALLATSEAFGSEAEAKAAITTSRDLIAGIVQYRTAITDGPRFALDREGSQWTFSLDDADGTALLVSQTYARRAAAITGIESVRKNGKDAARFSIVDSRFVIKATNGEEIAESAKTYDSPAAAQAAATSVRELLVSERVANPW